MVGGSHPDRDTAGGRLPAQAPVQPVHRQMHASVHRKRRGQPTPIRRDPVLRHIPAQSGHFGESSPGKNSPLHLTMHPLHRVCILA